MSCFSLWGSVKSCFSWVGFKTFAFLLLGTRCLFHKLCWCWWENWETIARENLYMQQLSLGSVAGGAGVKTRVVVFWIQTAGFYGTFTRPLWYILFFLSSTHLSVQTGLIKGQIVPGCFESRWTELARCACFNIHGLSYRTSLLQVEQATTTLVNTSILEHARTEMI